MVRILIFGAAVLALAACGTRQGDNAADANAAANLMDRLPNELADDQVSDANLANAAEPSTPAPVRPAPAAQPAPKAAPPRAEPRPPAAARAPVPSKARTEPDAHAGHDINNMSGE